MRLVGLLVFAESYVSIDAHHDLVCGAHVLGCEGLHRSGDLVDQREHGGFQLGLVDVLALVEPLAVVVAREAAEELEGFWGEVGGLSNHD